MEGSEPAYQMYCANLTKINLQKLSFKGNSSITNKTLQMINKGNSKMTNNQSNYIR